MSLIDSYTLSQDTTFRQRVRQAVLAHAGAVIAEAQTVAFHERRIKLVPQVVARPGELGDFFAEAIAGVAAVATAAGSPPVQASVTDAQITAAVAGVWNAMAGAYV